MAGLNVLALLVALPVYAATGAAAELPRDSVYRVRATWKDDSGAAIELGRWRGSPVVLAMFYTSCPFKCPLTVSKLREIERTMTERGERSEFVLVTFDPANDTPEKLARFRKREGLTSANWHFLSGSEPDTRALATRLGLGNYFEMANGIHHIFKIVRLDDEGRIGRALDWDHMDVASLFVPASTATP